MANKKDNPYEAPRAALIDPAPAAAIVPPWRSIWLRPRATFRELAHTPRLVWLIPLASIYGIANTLEDPWTGAGIANYFSWHRWALLAIPSGIALGVAVVYLYSWVVQLTARVLGGRGNAASIRIAVAWSCLPFTLYVAVELVVYWHLRESVFALAATAASPELMRALKFLVSIKTIATAWSLVIQTAGVSVLQRISLPRALAALLLAVLALTLFVAVAFPLAVPILVSVA